MEKTQEQLREESWAACRGFAAAAWPGRPEHEQRLLWGFQELHFGTGLDYEIGFFNHATEEPAVLNARAVEKLEQLLVNRFATENTFSRQLTAEELQVVRGTFPEIIEAYKKMYSEMESL